MYWIALCWFFFSAITPNVNVELNFFRMKFVYLWICWVLRFTVLQIFTLAESLGGFESLAEHPWVEYCWAVLLLCIVFSCIKLLQSTTVDLGSYVKHSICCKSLWVNGECMSVWQSCDGTSVLCDSGIMSYLSVSDSDIMSYVWSVCRWHNVTCAACLTVALCHICSLCVSSIMSCVCCMYMRACCLT